MENLNFCTAYFPTIFFLEIADSIAEAMGRLAARVVLVTSSAVLPCTTVEDLEDSLPLSQCHCATVR